MAIAQSDNANIPIPTSNQNGTAHDEDEDSFVDNWKLFAGPSCQN